MSVPRFWRQGSTIIDRENGWNEIGTYQDIAAEVLELRAENARLRAMLPSAEVRNALEECIRMHEHIMFVDETNTLARSWLDGLESEDVE